MERKIGDRVGEAQTLVNIGKAYFNMGHFDLAKSYLEESLTEYGAVGQPHYQDSIRRLIDEIDEVEMITPDTDELEIKFEDEEDISDVSSLLIDKDLVSDFEAMDRGEELLGKVEK
jgi:hypothetical protein